MREVLIRSPSVAFAFRINASQFAGACAPTGPSQAARPPAEHVGSGGTAAVTTAASPSAVRRCLSGAEAPASCTSRLPGSITSKRRCCFYPVGPLHHGTPKYDSVGKVLQNSSHLCARNRQVSTPFIPWLKPRGFLAERL